MSQQDRGDLVMSLNPITSRFLAQFSFARQGEGARAKYVRNGPDLGAFCMGFGRR